MASFSETLLIQFHAGKSYIYELPWRKSLVQNTLLLPHEWDRKNLQPYLRSYAVTLLHGVTGETISRHQQLSE